MKIVCRKSDLSNSINIVLKAVPSKTTMPILECIVIETNESIHLLTNETEIGIKTQVKGDIIEKGSLKATTAVAPLITGAAISSSEIIT